MVMLSAALVLALLLVVFRLLVGKGPFLFVVFMALGLVMLTALLSIFVVACGALVNGEWVF